MSGVGTNVVPLPSRPRAKPLEAAAREFLPSAMELLATPPSPIRIHLMLAICVLCALAIVIAWFGHIDIYAVARARTQPVGRSKVVQPYETGTVRAIHVTNGSTVEEGQLLLELDPTESSADQQQTRASLASFSAEVSRRRAAVAAARGGNIREAVVIGFDAQVDEATRSREQAVLDADLLHLSGRLESLRAKINEALVQKRTTQGAAEQQEKLVAVLQERLQMRQTLHTDGLESRANVIEAQAALTREQTNLAQLLGDLLRIDASIHSLQTELGNTVTGFIADNTEAIAQTQAKVEEAEQLLIKTSARVGYTRLHAPLSGSVQELAVTSRGQVVRTGEQLMTIVPSGSSLELEALIRNIDIGFVAVGQPVTIKFDAFPATRYGALDGKVTRVSHDAVVSREAGVSQGSPGAVPEVQDLVFPVTIALTRADIEADGRRIPLSAGMSATIEIRTGERRVLEYLISPLVKTVSEAAHER